VSDWIEWHGGERPVDGDVIVEYRMWSGVWSAAHARDLYWDHHQLLGDIVAYRVVGASPPKQHDDMAELRDALALIKELRDASMQTMLLARLRFGNLDDIANAAFDAHGTAIDKADAFLKEQEQQPGEPVKHGCHVDVLLGGEMYHTCEMDGDGQASCATAEHLTRKEDCPYWKPIDAADQSKLTGE